MANRIKGITIDIGANTTKLTDSLKGVNSSLKNTQTSLNDVNKLLKMDPGNVELLTQKQKLLTTAVADTKTKLSEEMKALEQLKEKDGGTGKYKQQMEALNREIIDTTNSLNKYSDELSKVHPRLDAVSASAEKLANKTKGISAFAAAGVAGLVGMAVKAGQTADELNTLSKQTGFTVEELQKMQYASSLIDVSMETMAGSAAKLTKNMASGSDAFKTLNVSIEDGNHNLRNASDVFYDVIRALSEISNETERDALAMEIFGKSAAEMAGVIDDGGSALKALGDEAEAAGLILSQDAVDGANKFNDSIDTMKAKAQAMFFEDGAKIADNMVPAMENITEVAGTLIEYIANMDSETLNMVTTTGVALAAATPVISFIGNTARGVSGVISLMSKMSTVALPALETAVETAMGGIMVAISPVLIAFDTFKNFMAATKNVIGAADAMSAANAYSQSTAGYTSITADVARNWMNRDEVVAMTNPTGGKEYFIANDNYTWGKMNAAQNGWTDSAEWDSSINVSVNVDHVNDLQDIINMTKSAKQMARMGGKS